MIIVTIHYSFYEVQNSYKKRKTLPSNSPLAVASSSAPIITPTVNPSAMFAASGEQRGLRAGILGVRIRLVPQQGLDLQTERSWSFPKWRSRICLVSESRGWTHPNLCLGPSNIYSIDFSFYIPCAIPTRLNGMCSTGQPAP